jgi:hypothetical protein
MDVIKGEDLFFSFLHQKILAKYHFPFTYTLEQRE